MASPIKGEWFKALICLLTIGSAYWYRDLIRSGGASL